MPYKLLSVLYSLWFMCLAPKTFSKPASSTALERIVFMERTLDSARVRESKNVHTLASVLGSDKEARKAIIYTFENIIDGFSAILTDPQVEALSKQPGVLKILPAPMYHLPQGMIP
ncbi:subtilisin-like protease SBT3.11 [Tasmannia lanceolata]|uniref:subtilisin-like protease SBT3.11 n=1 Tax=Tasmannia lanceolata TaxID=3420 RepID=UPI004062BBB4